MFFVTFNEFFLYFSECPLSGTIFHVCSEVAGWFFMSWCITLRALGSVRVFYLFVAFGQFWAISHFVRCNFTVATLVSIVLNAMSPKAFFALSCNSSKQSGSFCRSGSNTKRWTLCFTEDLDSGWIYFRQNTTKMSSRVVAGIRWMFSKSLKANPLKCEWK